MPLRWTRPALVARIEALEEKWSGDEFVAAVVSFADTLAPEDRELLQDVLLERADAERPKIDLRGRTRRNRR